MPSTRLRRGVAASLLGVAALMPSGLQAQTPPPVEESARDPRPPLVPAGLRFQVDPFAWLMVNVSGTATHAEQEVPVNATLGDLLSSFDIGAAARFEMWSGRWGLIASSSFLKTSASSTLGPGDAPFDVTNRLLLGDLLVGYRPLVLRVGDEGRASFELDAGAGLAWMTQDLSIAERSFSNGQGFARGIFGGRVPVRLSRLWVVGARGAIAVPGPSWSTLGWGEIDPLDWLGVTAGYRVERIDFSGDDVGVALTAHGPYLGVNLRFGSAPIY